MDRMAAGEQQRMSAAAASKGMVVRLPLDFCGVVGRAEGDMSVPDTGVSRFCLGREHVRTRVHRKHG